MNDAEANEEEEIFAAPFFLLRADEDCWKCGRICKVVGLASGHGEPFVLSDIESMPDAFFVAIKAIHPSYEKRLSHTAGVAYYMNTCGCGAHFGDFYLFSEPGGAFFPTSEKEAERVEVLELPIRGEHSFVCSPGMGTGGLMVNHGRRIEWDSLS